MTVDQNISSRINLMRMLLIAGIVFVHIPYNREVSPFQHDHGLFDWLRVFLGESLFRVGVPCLSAISGYLLFQRGIERFDYSRVIRSKSRTVLLPFLLWNLGLLALVFVVQKMGAGIGYFPRLNHATLPLLMDQALAIDGFPVNLPLYFLRDLLICILIAPVLALLVRRLPAITLGVLFAFAVFPELDAGIVLKNSILFSFTFGIFLALYRVDLKRFDDWALPLGALVTLSAALLAQGLYLTGPDYPDVLLMLRNMLSIFGAGGLWFLSAALIRTPVGLSLSRTGSLSFWTFCAHYPLLIGLWMVWNRFADPDLYPIFYTLAVLVTFAAIIVSHRLARQWAPGIYGVLTGHRARAKPGPGSPAFGPPELSLPASATRNKRSTNA
ncbi:acyltransferase family protein [Allorhizobium pseudoryzae]|uniref:acyltransferase family protein n=1 Tax=Allorhizobium pseudoryzae TaxID=379684 RepID=UPI003CFF5D23